MGVEFDNLCRPVSNVRIVQVEVDRSGGFEWNPDGRESKVRT